MNNSPYPDSPEDAKTEQQLTSMVSNFYQDADQYHNPFFTNMVEDYGFWDGTRQWIETRNGKEVDVKKELEAKGHPALTKNYCFSLINLIQGIQDDSRLTIKTTARSKEDSTVTEAATHALRYVWDINRADRLMSRQFHDGNICGRGWLAIEQQDDERDIFGTKTTIGIVDPAEIMYDRRSTKYDLSDSDYLLRIKIISRSEARIMWPDRDYELNQYYSMLDSRLASARLADSRLTHLQKDVMILECWYRVREQLTFLLDSSTGQIHNASGFKLDQIRALKQINPNVQVVRRTVKSMRFIRTCGAINSVLLDAGPSPYDDNYFPYIPYFAYRGRDLDFGVIKNIKDPQREINKRDSQAVRALNTGVKTRVITSDATLADQLEDGRDIAVVQKGADFHIIPPPQLSTAHTSLAQANKEDLKRISGLPDDLRGFKEAAGDSGVVLDIRRQQGLQNITTLFDNLQWTAELCGKVILSRIRQFATPQQLARILGPEKGTPEIISALKQKDVEDYDMAIEQSPSSPTLRAENIAKIERLLAIMPGIIPPDIVVEAIDPPGKEQILSRMKNAAEAAAATPMPGAGNAPLPPPLGR